jgi:hypothetical protein
VQHKYVSIAFPRSGQWHVGVTNMDRDGETLTYAINFATDACTSSTLNAHATSML